MSKNQQTQSHILRVADVLGRVPFGRTYLYAEIAAGRFPKPIKIGRLSVWSQSAVDGYLEKLVAGSAE